MPDPLLLRYLDPLYAVPDELAERLGIYQTWTEGRTPSEVLAAAGHPGYGDGFALLALTLAEHYGAGARYGIDQAYAAWADSDVQWRFTAAGKWPLRPGMNAMRPAGYDPDDPIDGEYPEPA